MRNKFILLILAITCVGAMLIGCEEDKGPKYVGNEVFNIDEDELPYTDEEIFDQLFDIHNKVEINIDISDEELLKIQEDYEKYSMIGSKSPIYREAAMDITITTKDDHFTYHIDEIGIRMKGNTSRTDFYSSSEGQYNLIHFKIDFQETFDDDKYYDDVKDWSEDEAGLEARKDRTFATLENIELKWNKNDDSTYIREYYAYEMYRDNGVLAPHTNLASLDLGSLHQGVFTIYEPVDKVFIEKYVDEKDQGGDLYKCGWSGIGANLTSGCSIGIEDEDAGWFFNYDLKTNKKTSDHQAMRNLIARLNGKVTKESLDELVDMEQFLAFEAVSYFVGNPDDVRNDYNNHYIYFLKSSGKAIFIPYDLDRCFGVTRDWNPTGDGMTGVNPFSQNAEGIGEPQQNPLYIYTVDEGGYYVEEFTEILKEMVECKWLTADHFSSIYDIASEHYEDDAKPDKAFGNAMWHGFEFSLMKTDGLNTSTGNASFAQYIKAKMKAFDKYVIDVD